MQQPATRKQEGIGGERAATSSEVLCSSLQQGDRKLWQEPAAACGGCLAHFPKARGRSAAPACCSLHGHAVNACAPVGHEQFAHRQLYGRVRQAAPEHGSTYYPSSSPAKRCSSAFKQCSCSTWQAILQPEEGAHGRLDSRLLLVQGARGCRLARRLPLAPDSVA